MEFHLKNGLSSKLFHPSFKGPLQPEAPGFVTTSGPAQVAAPSQPPYKRRLQRSVSQMHPQLYLHLTFQQETRQIPHRAFPRSKTKILGPPPTPKYT
ncbi:hypothetical protein FHG87_015291 [Trinorchestia longiramus]|nr:hypothetical protein FHG87_015291 [Trinorchestia longiramus]